MITKTSVFIGEFPISPAENVDWGFLYGMIVTFVGV